MTLTDCCGERPAIGYPRRGGGAVVAGKTVRKIDMIAVREADAFGLLDPGPAHVRDRQAGAGFKSPDLSADQAKRTGIALLGPLDILSLPPDVDMAISIDRGADASRLASGKAARQIDTQLDDGLSNNGSIRATQAVAGQNTPPGAAIGAYNDNNVYTLCRTL